MIAHVAGVPVEEHVIVPAHVGVVPVEEIVPALAASAGKSTGSLAALAFASCDVRGAGASPAFTERPLDQEVWRLGASSRAALEGDRELQRAVQEHLRQPGAHQGAGRHRSIRAGAVLVYQLALLSQYVHRQDPRVDLEAFLEAACEL